MESTNTALRRREELWNNTLRCSRACFHDSINNKTTPDAALSELWRILDFFQFCWSSTICRADNTTKGVLTQLNASFRFYPSPCALQTVRTIEVAIWPFTFKITSKAFPSVSFPLGFAYLPLPSPSPTLATNEGEFTPRHQTKPNLMTSSATIWCPSKEYEKMTGPGDESQQNPESKGQINQRLFPAGNRCVYAASGKWETKESKCL